MSLTPLHYNRTGYFSQDPHTPMYGYSQYITDCGRFTISRGLTITINGKKQPPVWGASLTRASVDNGIWLQWFTENDLISWHFPTRQALLDQLTQTLAEDGLLDESITL